MDFISGKWFEEGLIKQESGRPCESSGWSHPRARRRTKRCLPPGQCGSDNGQAAPLVREGTPLRGPASPGQIDRKHRGFPAFEPGSASRVCCPATQQPQALLALPSDSSRVFSILAKQTPGSQPIRRGGWCQTKSWGGAFCTWVSKPHALRVGSPGTGNHPFHSLMPTQSGHPPVTGTCAE